MEEKVKEQSWKDFFRLIFKSKLPWHLYILGLIIMLATTTLTLGLPIYIQEIFAGNIFDFEIVYKYILLSASATVLASLSALFISITSPITQRNIQMTLWSKIIRMPMREYSKQPSQQLISRITRDTSFIDEVITYINTVITSTFTLTASYMIMYNMNAKLTYALFPVIPYILIVTAVVGHYTQKTQKDVQANFSNITAFFAERLPKINLIKSFGKEKEEIDEANDVLLENYEAEKKRAFVDLFAEPLMQSVQGIIIGIVLVYGGILVSKGELRISEVIAFYLYVQFIHNNVLKYGLFWQTLKQAKGASEKITAILDSDSEDLQSETPMNKAIKDSNGELKLENITFSYDERPVLNNLNFTIPIGKVTAIVGPSGCGKSTILNLLERFYEPDLGQILLGRTAAETIHLEDWRRSIALVSQASPLLSGTIRDNITYGINREVGMEEVRRAAELADALDFIESFADGFDTDVGEFGSKLSGGQRQRVAIARAFMKDSEFLLLDEATSSLDARSENKIEQSLEKLMVGRTSIVIAHDMDFIKNADQIIVIDNGSVMDTGTHDELIKTNELYQILVEIQSEKSSRLSSH